MFTNEIDFDETITTIMDDTAQLEDVKVYIDGNEVYIRQWNDVHETHEMVVMSYKMFQEFLAALDETEGMFKIED